MSPEKLIGLSFAAPAAKPEPSPTPAQRKRLAALDALLEESLVTRDEYDAKRREILGVEP